MRYIAAYLLLQLGGSTTPSAADIKRVLGSVDVKIDEERLQQFLAAIKGKDVAQLIQEGSAKLAVPHTGPETVRQPDMQESPPHDSPGVRGEVQEALSDSDSEDGITGFLLFD